MKTFSPLEKQATLSLAILFALRMLGLFLVLPVFALYASSLPHATPTLMGIALGIYGFTQAALQLPFGKLSDHFQRKKIITLGLIFFIIGSLLAATAHSIQSMIIARALQGASAIGSATLALVSDLTTENKRSSVMAIMGISIGVAFLLAMLLGPLLNHWLSVPSLFIVSACSGLLALIVLWQWVPNTLPVKTLSPISLTSLLFDPRLARLNFGILMLHALLTANFIAIPFTLKNNFGIENASQGFILFPILAAACACMWPLMKYAERKQQTHHYYLIAIASLFASQVLSWFFSSTLILFCLALFIFFTAFTLLEAWLPSFISKVAPAHSKGTAMGLYSCSQFVGIFLGGLLGGWAYGRYNLSGLLGSCLIITSLWLFIEMASIKLRRTIELNSY